MSRIAILGATSQIARDLIPRLANQHELALFSRRPEAISFWLARRSVPLPVKVEEFDTFSSGSYDAVVNFVGIGDPARCAAMGREILDATLSIDDLVLSYLEKNPTVRYLFMSSGAVYGTTFSEPASKTTPTRLMINDFKNSEYYSFSKISAEIRHRMRQDLAIFDIRIFNYFSRTQDLRQRFFLSDIVRSIVDGETLRTTDEYIVRDFIDQRDFSHLVLNLLSCEPANTPVDCYSLATIDKPSILKIAAQEFGLKYEVSSNGGGAPVMTGHKTHYYSTWRKAADFGYIPEWDSATSITEEISAVIGR